MTPDFGAVRITWDILPMGAFAYVREKVDGIGQTLIGPVPAEKAADVIERRKRLLREAIAQANRIGEAQP